MLLYGLPLDIRFFNYAFHLANKQKKQAKNELPMLILISNAINVNIFKAIPKIHFCFITPYLF